MRTLSDQLQSWTHHDFDQLSWHDCHVHGLAIAEGEHGAGELTLDIDFISDWIYKESGEIHFKVAPATLSFFEITCLKIAIDYAEVTAGMTPFSINAIERSVEDRRGYVAVVWRMPINWPAGEICFESTGFLQKLRAPPIETNRQCLTPAQRRS